jgi:CBS domain-containing protein
MNYHLTAGDIMQTEVETILGDLTVQEAATLMRFAGTRSLLVIPRQEGHPYGIVSYSDIVYRVIAEGKDPRRTRIDEITTTPALAVRPDDNVQKISSLFRKHGIGHAPVVDEHGKLIGIISMTDLVTEVITEPE